MNLPVGEIESSICFKLFYLLNSNWIWQAKASFGSKSQ